MNGIPKLTLILNPVTFDYAAGKTTMPNADIYSRNL